MPRNSQVGLARRDDADLKALDNFDRIYKTQQLAISRRLLGSKQPTQNRAVAYLTDSEMEAVKGLADSVGTNVSTLIRLTMTTLAASFISDGEPDPRQTANSL